jgi:hypothetical protein
VKTVGAKVPARFARLGGRIFWPAWCLLVAFGFHRAFLYESTPGEPASASAHWPSEATLTLDPARPTLVLFLHPRCPCSRATLDELEKLVARLPRRMAVRAVFYADDALGEGWELTALWQRAEDMPGVTLVADRLGAEARRFDAHASGQVFLYSRAGVLLFQGGITRGRGHAGDNPGAQAIAELIEGRAPATVSTPAFGCCLESAPDGALP